MSFFDTLVPHVDLAMLQRVHVTNQTLHVCSRIHILNMEHVSTWCKTSLCPRDPDQVIITRGRCPITPSTKTISPSATRCLTATFASPSPSRRDLHPSSHGRLCLSHFGTHRQAPSPVAYPPLPGNARQPACGALRRSVGPPRLGPARRPSFPSPRKPTITCANRHAVLPFHPRNLLQPFRPQTNRPACNFTLPLQAVPFRLGNQAGVLIGAHA